MSRTAKAWEAAPQLPSDHYVHAAVYTDEQIFREEHEKILRRTWTFACHESELSEIGDYRTFTHTGIPLVLIRGEDRRIRTFINTCSHRSAKIARAPSGNSKRLTCFFHLWGYDIQGECVGMTRPAGYEAVGLTKEHCGLREVKTDICLGMVFVNLDDNCIPLHEFIGDASESMREVMTTEDLEVFHYHKIVVRANWKQWHETNMELYHDWGHVVNRTTGVHIKGYDDRRWKIYPHAHAMVSPFKASFDSYGKWGRRDQQLLPGLSEGEVRVLDIFPHTTIIARATAIRIDTVTPISPGRSLIEYRGLGVKGESEQQRALRVKHHNEFWGPFGRNLLEDVLFVEAVEESNRNGAAQYGLLARHENMGPQDDEVLREFYRVWGAMMGRQASNPLGSSK